MCAFTPPSRNRTKTPHNSLPALPTLLPTYLMNVLPTKFTAPLNKYYLLYFISLIISYMWLPLSLTSPTLSVLSIDHKSIYSVNPISNSYISSINKVQYYFLIVTKIYLS